MISLSTQKSKWVFLYKSVASALSEGGGGGGIIKCLVNGNCQRDDFVLINKELYNLII